jgi:hypothetical protein
MAELFTDAWAEQVREAINRGPDATLRAAKLDVYWDWIDRARSDLEGSWALGVRDLPGAGPTYLRLGWRDGTCAEAAIVEGAPDATYVLAADLATWQDLLAGEDPGRIVMYRRLRLERGDILAFFRRIYLFVEAVAAIGRVPADLPLPRPAHR